MKHLLIILLIAFPLLSFGQENILEQYVQEAFKENLGLAKEQLLLNEQTLKVEEAKGKYLPTVNFNASYLVADGGRTFVFPLGSLFNPIYGTLNEVTGTDAFQTTLEDQEFQLTPNDFYETRISITQPIFNPSITYNKRIQEQLLNVQESKQGAYQTQLRQQVEVAYFNYLKTLKVHDIYDSTEVLLNELLKLNKKLVKYDKATEDAITNVEYEVEKLNSDRAAINQQEAMARAYFNTLLHRELNTPIEVDQSLIYNLPSDSSLSDLRQQALDQRLELVQLTYAISTQEVVKELNRKQLLPTIGMELTGGYQGEGVNFTNDQRLFTAAVAFNWTLFEGKQRQSRIAQAELQTRQLEKDRAMAQQQIELQVINSWHAYKAAEEKLLAEEAALKSAEKSFRIIRRRYENQQALLFEYLDARTKFTNAQISVSLAAYDRMIRQAELKGAVGEE